MVRLAEIATDDWALATRALVDVGRKALADAIGLRIPIKLSEEREMWRLYCQFVRRPYDESRAARLSKFRIADGVVGQRES